MKFKKKKVAKYRGSTYHGYGRGHAHHKGAGNRGGRGRAGSGKRADCKKPMFYGESSQRRNFKSYSRFKIMPINIDELASMMPRLIETGIAKKTGAGIELELRNAGFNKLLSRGNTKEKLLITTERASAKAIEKISAAGGKVTVLFSSEDDAEFEEDAAAAPQAKPAKQEQQAKAAKPAKSAKKKADEAEE